MRMIIIIGRHYRWEWFSYATT